MAKEKLLVTGAESYIGCMLFKEKYLRDNFSWIELKCGMQEKEILNYLTHGKYLIHLFESKTGTTDQLISDNVKSTEQLIALMEESTHTLPFIYISSDYDNSDYGRSKLLSEQLIREYGQRQRIRNMIYRLPVLMGEQLYRDASNPLHDICRQLILGQEKIALPDQAEHKFVDIKDLVKEFTRALSGRAFYATVDLSICVIPSEHHAGWDRVLAVLREIRERGEDYPLAQYRADSFEYKLYRTYSSLSEYYSSSGIKYS